MQTTPDGSVADAVKGNWVDRFAPNWLKPFARLARWDRPIGWWLLLWPCWWSVALASGAAGRLYPEPTHLALFMIGAIAMRGAGCTYNDIVDRNLDGSVERTRSRPIPSGQVSVFQAAFFLVLQSLVGLAVLLSFNSFTIFLGIASLAVVAVYPFMKRVTDWPQFVLGLAFTWGALMGWAAEFGRLGWPPLALYCGGILWTIGYDTIYAHQDKEDDALVGVRSTARLFGDWTKPALVLLYIGATCFFALAATLADTGPLAFLGLAAGALHLGWQIVVLDIDEPDQCLKLFKANRGYGWIVFTGLVADAMIGNL
ncbi:4-hydroxybenzoate octaprenyltransferase [Breoghania sp. L-A4]|uniref:4-hydroxybenzoate octaprenyltransferase n=1 Tax=Breoghania sp. L-A4 TaxID=2304600 RepID=UPI000E35B862|nr:4-hydroxybenzoate octaprenyltransferase [Breoghania sp. L-A4]AXS39464.1 4-hydroxybenzoate octaprenyltransferase [Breoghania sp. L-A4]